MRWPKCHRYRLYRALRWELCPSYRKFVRSYIIDGVVKGEIGYAKATAYTLYASGSREFDS